MGVQYALNNINFVFNEADETLYYILQYRKNAIRSHWFLLEQVISAPGLYWRPGFY